MKTETILKEVERTFSFTEKPKGTSISFHKHDCLLCNFLRKDLEPYKSKEIPYAAIREIYQDMSCLSAEGWRWVLPSYLWHCLTVNDDASGMETEFLVYNLGPSLEDQADTKKRLSELNEDQIVCLIKFMLWCKGYESWSTYGLEHIEQAIDFLLTLKK